ncbi:MAG: hypothetical protein IJ064_04375 [Bacteroidaceae bacterium]|nr:hypothetical protein [Bacteroidaceae bacterium]
MKKNIILWLMISATLMTGMLTSCSSDGTSALLNDEVRPDFGLVRTPDFRAYSGSSELIVTPPTRSANVNGNLWYQEWQRPTNVTPEEVERVVAEFSTPRPDAHNTRQVTWRNFWVQQVYKGEATYTDGYGQNIGRASDKMNHLQVFNNLRENVISWWPKEVEIEEWAGSYEHINNFNNGTNTTVYTDDVTGQQYVGTTLMVTMGSDGRAEQFAYHNTVDSKYHYDYIILEIDGAYYVGFDFYAHGTDDYPANKNMDVERDWVFNDWIVKISPAQKLGESEADPTLPTIDPTTPPSIPDTPSVGEVEVNLSINAPREKDDYIATKLSIHVRDTTDVEVFIPVEAQYYCDTDDMNIVLSHRLEAEIHSPLSTSATYVIDGHEVTATVSYELGGIRIQTHGINAEVLKYLRNQYGDGITFEIWNYYNNQGTRETLKPLFDASTVTFTNATDQYINAFARLGEERNPLDCTVTPPAEYGEGQANDGTANYNVIYRK